MLEKLLLLTLMLYCKARQWVRRLVVCLKCRAVEVAIVLIPDWVARYLSACDCRLGDGNSENLCLRAVIDHYWCCHVEQALARTLIVFTKLGEALARSFCCYLLWFMLTVLVRWVNSNNDSAGLRLSLILNLALLRLIHVLLQLLGGLLYLSIVEALGPLKLVAWLIHPTDWIDDPLMLVVRAILDFISNILGKILKLTAR